jgi:ribonuclease Y
VSEAEGLEARRRAEREQAAAEARRLLAEIAGSTEEEARRRLLAEIDHELEGVKARRLAVALESARLEAETRSREILLGAMQRMAASTCATSTVVRGARENEAM